MNRLAIDPGDKHVGWASLIDGVAEAGEWSPTKCINETVHFMTRDSIDELIVEEFQLYEWEAKKQAWSNFLTPQLIGGLKVVAYFFRIPVVEQGAYIKKPTRARMQAEGIPMARGSIHTNDAQCHLWYRELRSRRESG